MLSWCLHGIIMLVFFVLRVINIISCVSQCLPCCYVSLRWSAVFSFLCLISGNTFLVCVSCHFAAHLQFPNHFHLHLVSAESVSILFSSSFFVWLSVYPPGSAASVTLLLFLSVPSLVLCLPFWIVVGSSVGVSCHTLAAPAVIITVAP